MATALRDYKPGDLIYKGKPFVRVFRKDLWSLKCGFCFKRSSHLKRCAACKLMRYCGKSCQCLAWEDHKLECSYLKNLQKESKSFVHLLGNLILKLQGREWKKITEKMFDTEISLDDLVSHIDHLTRNPHFKIQCETIVSGLKVYIGEQNLPGEDEVIELIGKVLANHYSFGIESKREVEALFIGASKFDHSCVPNTTCYFDGKVISIRASMDILKSEKVTITYIPFISTFESTILYEEMKNSFFRSCSCSDCSQPYGMSPLTKILDVARAPAVISETDGVLMLMTLMERHKLPVDVSIIRGKLKELLELQEGVLGNTNLLRIRALAMKCFLKNGGHLEETRRDLIQLAQWVKKAWGENYEELIPVYKKLQAISLLLRDFPAAAYCMKEHFRLAMICYGEKGPNFELLTRMFSSFCS